ncbi:unnamed protein product [Ilex paraguariensis]|uniref:Uncharacterized protein n=1 Tax=Ilex paraguariensis TaxID=185542 RepID=A0ABC8RJA7_9AQUA
MYNRSPVSSSSSSELALPPPPIPTGKGSRSAASPVFSEFIDRSKHVPELTFPEHVPRGFVPAVVDYQSLKWRDSESVERLLRSALEFGVFRISGHGITVEELRATLAEAKWVFGLSMDCCRRYGDRQEFVWCHSNEAMAEKAAKQAIRGDQYQSFRDKMENISSKLGAIAGVLAQVISGSMRKQSTKTIQPIESILSLYRYNPANDIDQRSYTYNEIDHDSCKYDLRLNLLLGQGAFSTVKSERPHLSFNTSPETIVVTIAEQLVECWSLGEFNSDLGKVDNFESNNIGSQPLFSFELKYSFPNLNQRLSSAKRTISLVDQIIILAIVTLLYRIFALTLC